MRTFKRIFVDPKVVIRTLQRYTSRIDRLKEEIWQLERDGDFEEPQVLRKYKSLLNMEHDAEDEFGMAQSFAREWGLLSGDELEEFLRDWEAGA